MQANSAEHCTIEQTPTVLGATSDLIDGTSLMEEQLAPTTDANCFHGSFSSCMEMYADTKTVADYLDGHRAWFPRCARPMKVEAIGDTGYALTIGRFGSFGYEVEPRIGLNLLPQDHGIYRIETISVPGYQPVGYDVDFQAALQLIETDPTNSDFSPLITRVEWELDLKVLIQFPRFIQALPKSLVQSTGDRLLNQIVRQVSRRLTHKVQQDFHQTIGIPFPRRR
ncbi:DUF1997 domain-containing protein [Thermocoleostomius sinensis]|uniref:DUF1997 domain-containing protein n=1 Tax=Thermocoleostomius sinensis A174 TaxID=2016057 RepID=A0A9E8ZPK4_9CYAN|nr:DUF1997 domain-containing protein [Thermocoleostomius sinensis]WAL62576.1 DUF1997 domain-containing protein [Thermocoleostomius sinensis A174]